MIMIQYSLLREQLQEDQYLNKNKVSSTDNYKCYNHNLQLHLEEAV